MNPKQRTIRFIGIIFLFFSFWPAASFAGDTVKIDEILTGIEKKYAGNSFSTHFSQTSKLAALDISDQASGKAYFSHPGKMRWEYETPDTYSVITNGKTLWIFRPEENQVTVKEAAQVFKTGAGAAFLSDISLMRKNFDIRIKETAPTYIELDMTAVDGSSSITAITLRITRKTFEIIRVVTYDAFDNTTLFEFNNSKFESIPPEKFEFKIPPGVTIMEMD